MNAFLLVRAATRRYTETMQDRSDDNRGASGPERPEPGPGGPAVDPAGPAPGIFDRINNYLLLVYAFACLLMNYSLAGLFYFEGMIV
ncbi:MAG: hypothetical protein NTW97_07230, partial [Candidatus Krumholzibacteria bacterium]|nr:hypothetical protein [Candidatus Krumholzibacteria bacterium]